MPATRRPAKAKKTTKKTAKRTAKRAGRGRTLSSAHKKALAEGRTMSATIDRYMTVVMRPKKRGRQVSKATLATRLTTATTRSRQAIGIERLLAAQEVRDIKAKLSTMNGSSSDAEIKSLEASFVRVAKKFSENRGISYGAWRDAGVPAPVLAKAGIARTRG